MFGWIMLAGGCQGPESADQVFHGDFRLDSVRGTDALAAIDGVVVAHGDEARAMVGAGTQEVTLAGTVWPGFIDSHAHVMAGSFVLERLMLLGTSSMDSLLSQLADYAEEAPDEPWIVGYGWLVELLGEPDGRLLDDVVSDRPVLLVDNSAHSAVANSLALELAGIDASTEDPPGGTIVRDPKTGEPTGLLYEAALSLVSEAALGAYDDEDLAEGVRPTLKDFAAGGLTGVSEIMASPGFDLSRPEVYAALEEAGELPLRVHWSLPIFQQSDLATADELRSLYEGELSRFAACKVWVDGSMGTSSAWVSEPLANDPDNFGSHYFDTAELTAIVEEAESRGLPLKLHVNGDAAVAAAVDAFEAVAAQRGLVQQHVLEHAVLVSDEDKARIAELGLVVSVQPAHYLGASFSDTSENWGDERFEAAYDFVGIADAGAVIAMGTDWPVWLNAEPLLNAWSAATTQDDGLSVGQALDGYASGSAAALGRPELGCLDVGCVLDLVAIDGDPLAVALEDLPDLSIDAVWVAGQPVD